MNFKIFNRRNKISVERLYFSIVAQSRQVHFFREWLVPDTVEGRFEMIALHVILVLNRLAEEKNQTPEVGQIIFDRFFADMEDNLRELGVSDLKVPKKVKKLAEKFYGRAKAYKPSLLNGDLSNLSAALERIIYTGSEGAVCANHLASYALKVSELLSQLPIARVLSGEFAWINPSESVEKE